jgi:hypothetical protein
MQSNLKKLTLLLSVFITISSCSGAKQSSQSIEPVLLPEQIVAVESPLPTYEPVESGIFDNGRMWTFEYAPIDYFSTTYNFNPTNEWFEKARLGSVRLPNCSGSFISPKGLVMTNHHCAREQITQVSLDGEDLLDKGFYATNLSDERIIADYYVDQVIEIRDVTDIILAEVDLAAEEMIAEVRQNAVRSLQAKLMEEMQDVDDIVVEVISLYNGGRYSAYFFKRYSDIRLVMAPELQIGYYGGDDDNFTYPRYNLDMTFYRVYENDKPLQSPYYFPFSRTGVEEGDVVFLIGNPGNTTRQQTVSQLAYRGVFGDKYRHILFDRTIQGLEAYYEFDPIEADTRDLRNFIFALKNAEKFYGGQVEALNNPELMGRRTWNDLQFRRALIEDATLANQYIPIIDEIEAIQLDKIEYAPMYYISLGISPNSSISPAIMQRAIFIYLYATYMEMGSPEQALKPFRAQISNINDKPMFMDLKLLESRINLIVDILGENHELVGELLSGRTPFEVAEHIINNSLLLKAATVDQVFETDILNSDDPALVMARILGSGIFEAQQNYSELSEREDELLSQLGRAWFSIYGTSIPPDATFSLRISDGIVSGYTYNGTKAPAYTTFYGLYDRANSHVNDSQWNLPTRWEKPSITLDLATPINFVSTNDIIGGNSGSPVLNINLEVVGLAFDSNIEGMGSSDFILDSNRARAVSVDVRGMLESLRHVYKADRLVKEIIDAGAY